MSAAVKPNKPRCSEARPTSDRWKIAYTESEVSAVIGQYGGAAYLCKTGGHWHHTTGAVVSATGVSLDRTD